MAIVFLGIVFLIFAEIALFIWLALEFGWIAMLALTLLTSFLGLSIHKIQSRNLYKNIANLLQTTDVTNSFMDMSLAALGPWFLIFPGFITDFLGLCLLVKPFRKIFIRLSKTRLFQRIFPSPMANLSGFTTGTGPGSFAGGFSFSSNMPNMYQNNTTNTTGGSSNSFDSIFNMPPENYAEKMEKLRPLLDQIIATNINSIADGDDDDELNDEFDDEFDDEYDDDIDDIDDDIIDAEFTPKNP